MKNFFKKRISRKDKRVLGSLAFVFFATLIPLMGYAVTSDVSFDERAAAWVFSNAAKSANPGIGRSGSSGSSSGSIQNWTVGTDLSPFISSGSPSHRSISYRWSPDRILGGTHYGKPDYIIARTGTGGGTSKTHYRPPDHIVSSTGIGGGEIPEAPICGSYDGLVFVGSEDVWPKDGTFCSEGVSVPVNPIFPSEGDTTSWECTSGTELVFCSASKELGESCSTNSDCDTSKSEVCLKELQVCIKGDIMETGEINMKDFLAFKEDFFEYKRSGWSENLKRSDLNGDGMLSMADFSLFIRSYRLFNKID